MYRFHFKEYQLVFPKIFLGVVGATIKPVGAIIESDLSVQVCPQECTNTSIFDTSMTGKGTVINWIRGNKPARFKREELTNDDDISRALADPVERDNL